VFERLHIGTSGWSYPHWSGLFYPEGLKPAKYLEHYVTAFGCVELNASFYRLPAIKTVEGWARRTPAGFRFCAKVSRFITHRKKLIDVSEPIERFLEVFAALQGRLGPFLVQLPPSLQFDPDPAGAFLKLLASHQDAYTFALEARHASWHTPEAQSLLQHSGIINVIADSGGRFPQSDLLTSRTVYLRFHGPGATYGSRYSIESLMVYARKIIGCLAEAREVWAFFNNDIDGHAVHNARELQALCEKAGNELGQ
jgi:uncharacterized protein YecE (DUF72 family)